MRRFRGPQGLGKYAVLRQQGKQLTGHEGAKIRQGLIPDLDMLAMGPGQNQYASVRQGIHQSGYPESLNFLPTHSISILSEPGDHQDGMGEGLVCIDPRAGKAAPDKGLGQVAVRQLPHPDRGGSHAGKDQRKRMQLGLNAVLQPFYVLSQNIPKKFLPGKAALLPCAESG